MMRQVLCIFVVMVFAGLASCSRGSFISQHDRGLAESSATTQKESAERRTASNSQSSVQQESRTRESRQTGKRSGSGKLIGGISNSNIAGFLDDSDKKAAAEAEFRALEYGNPGVATPWRNPTNGKYGNVVASKPFKQMNIHCRQYTHTIYINGRPEITRKTACRNKDGSWQDLG